MILITTVGKNIWPDNIFPTIEFSATKTLKYRKFDLKVIVKKVGNLCVILLHSFPRQRAHVCQNVRFLV